MTAYSATCTECRIHCVWMPGITPFHGFWKHSGTTQFHAPVIDWQPIEVLDDVGGWRTV